MTPPKAKRYQCLRCGATVDTNYIDHTCVHYYEGPLQALPGVTAEMTAEHVLISRLINGRKVTRVIDRRAPIWCSKEEFGR